VARELFGYMGVSTNVNFTGTWTSAQVPVGNGLAPQPGVGDNPAITINRGSVNIADEDGSGNLDFYWQDSSGTFHQETVDTAANL